MEEKTIIYRSSAVHYRIIGKGKTVVLLHGFAEDSNIWHHQVDTLQNYFRLLIPDIPGSGKSALIKDADIETYADVVKMIIDEDLQESPPGSGTGQISLIGHSMGGYIALAFAEKYPDNLSSFGLFHSTAFADNEEKKQARMKSIEFIKTNGAMAFLKTSITGLFTKDFTESMPEKVDELIRRGENFSPEALIQYYEAMIARPDRTSVLRNFPRPVLFIMGEHDTAVPLQSNLQQCYIPVASHVHVLKNSAHMGMWEEWQRSNEILLDFLNNYEKLL